MTKMQNRSIAGAFVVMSILFGILFTVITPPFQAPDEDSHFKKAYVMAYGQIIPKVEDGNVGFYLSDNMVNYIKECLDTSGNRDTRVSYSSVILDEKLPKSYDDKSFYTFSTAVSNPIAHIIPAIGIFFGRIVAKITQGGYASAVYLLYFARLANVLFYSLMVGFSIKIIPVLKKTMFFLGLIPMSLFLSASCSYDTLVTSCCCLAIAIIFKLIYDDEYKLNYINMVVMAILAATLLMVKPNYAVIFLLLFFMPQSKFKDIKDYLISAGKFLVIVLIGYFIFKIPGYLISGTIVGAASRAGEQMAYITSHPLAFFQAVGNSFSTNMSFYFHSTVSLVGLIDTYIPSAIIYLYILVLVMLGVADASLYGKKTNIFLRVASVLIPLIAILAVFFVMYWTWTPNELGVGTNLVTGVQGRYFIPVLVLPFVVFQNTKLQENKYIKKGLVAIYNNSEYVVYGTVLVTLVFLLIRYWS